VRKEFPSIAELVETDEDITKPEVLRGGETLSHELVDEDAQQDPLFVIATQNPDSSEVLNQIIQSLAYEASLLNAERKFANTKERTNISAKKVAALKALGDVWIKRREQSAAMIDMEGQAFKALFRYLLETFLDCLGESALRKEQVDTILAHLQRKINDDWKAEAKSRMRAAR